MDLLDIFYNTALFVLLLVIFLVSYIYLTCPTSHYKKFGIPGPGPTYVFQPKHQMVKDKELIEIFGKVVGYVEAYEQLLVLADTDMLKEIYIKDFENFCNRRLQKMRGVLKHGILDIQGQEQWKRQRSQLSRYFTTAKNKMSMASLNKSLDGFIAMLHKKCEVGEMIEARSLSCGYTIDAICRTAYGVEIDNINNPDQEVLKEMKEFGRKLSSVTWKLMITGLSPTLAKLMDLLGFEVAESAYMSKFITQIIKEREKSKEETDDFIGTLTKGKLEDGEKGSKGLTDKEIIANGIFFLGAAFETTANTMGFLLYNLAVFKECQEKLFKEVTNICGKATPTYEDILQMEYLDMCIDETLRLYPSAGRLERMCMRDTVVKGVPIKKGTLVILPIWYFHSNPEIWPEPEKFIPERFTPEKKKNMNPIHYCPFGIGPKHCIGMRLAKLEVKLAISRMIQQFNIQRNIKTQVPLVLDQKFFLLRPEKGISLTLEKREK